MIKACVLLNSELAKCHGNNTTHLTCMKVCLVDSRAQQFTQTPWKVLFEVEEFVTVTQICLQLALLVLSILASARKKLLRGG